ncbi:hypothetical protein C8J56DRAFT_1005780 [Mycena floridula]|nr:hypothetical protein C8J56DRAFT_1005780 [Mycena floridula]
MVKKVKAKASAPPVVIFPEISPKQEPEFQTILEDQIIVLHEFLSPKECKAWAKMIDDLPLELTPPAKRGEANRFNCKSYRFSVTSPEFADTLHRLLIPHLPKFPHPKRSQDKRVPYSFNSNIRMYKYTPSQHFGPHYDDSVRDTITGAKSEWTLLIYISGREDGVEGGEDEKCDAAHTITVPLTRGTALLHRHGQDCMLHEGSKVHKGTKYVLRSDLMFK